MAKKITRTESHHHIAGKVEHELTFKPDHSMGAGQHASAHIVD